MFLTSLHFLLLLAVFSPGATQSNQLTPDRFQKHQDRNFNNDNDRQLHLDSPDNYDRAEHISLILLNNITSAIMTKDSKRLESLFTGFRYRCGESFYYGVSSIITADSQPIFATLSKADTYGDDNIRSEIIIYGYFMQPVKVLLKIQLETMKISSVEPMGCNSPKSVPK